MEHVYNLIMDELPIAYCYNKILYDEDFTPYDYEFIYANKEFEKVIGLLNKDILGKRASQINSIEMNSDFKWIKIFGEMALSEEKTTLEEYGEIYNGYYKIKAFSPEKHYIAIYIMDITEEIDHINEINNLKNVISKSEEKYKTIANHAYDWEIWEDEKGKIVYISPSCERISGYTADEFMSDPTLLTSIIIEEDREAWNKHRKEALLAKGHSSLQFRIKHKEGKVVWIEHVCSPMLDEEGEYIGHHTNNRDITESKLMELKLRKSEEKYRFLTEHVSDVIWIYNLDRKKIDYISPSVYQLLGYTAEEFLNISFEEILTPNSREECSNRFAMDIERFRKKPDESIQHIIQFQHICKNKDIIWVEASIKYRYNSQGEIEIIGVSRDIEERKKAEEKILYLSYYDQLTGLYNRRYYEEELKRIDKQENLPISLIVADVNGLKLANDAFGHNVGDKLLKAFASILKKEVRSNDLIARVSGDEFVILLPKTNISKAKRIARRIKNATSIIAVNNIILSASLGYATKDSMDIDINNIFSKAEDNMYRNKLYESNDKKGETIRVIIESLFNKSNREKEHSKNVSNLCKRIGIALGLDQNKIKDLTMLGLFHDIGKIGISEKVLNKKTPLNDEEWYEMKRHSEIGYQILRSVNEFSYISEYVLSHHERIDGKGYPQGLKGIDIPLESRILAIAEAYDSMTNHNSYKAPMTKSEAIEELMINANTQFDKDIVKVFIEKVLSEEGFEHIF